MRKRILFITPFGRRTGSEVVLWNLLKNLDHSKFEVQLLSLENGKMLNELPKEITYHVSDKRNKKVLPLIRKVYYKAQGVSPVIPQIKKLHAAFKPDYWFINTIVVPDVIKAGLDVDVKIVTYSHELFLAYSFLKADQFNRLVQRTDTFIGCSESVCNQFKRIGHKDVRLQHGFIDTSAIGTDPENVTLLRKKHKVADDDFIWVVSGHTGYLKGIDYLPALLDLLKKERFKIFWLGPLESSGIHAYINRFIDIYYPGKVIFTGMLEGADYYDYFSLANSFLMLSKEDSFSLVALEAAYLGKPILSFNSGGITEFVKEGMGEIVNSWNVQDMAAAMAKFMKGEIKFNPEISIEQAKVYSIEQQVPKFEKLLSEL